MANRAYEYDHTIVRARRADGTVTTIGMPLMSRLALFRLYPLKKARSAAVNAASAEYDRLHGSEQRSRANNRSAFVRRALGLE